MICRDAKIFIERERKSGSGLYVFCTRSERDLSTLAEAERKTFDLPKQADPVQVILMAAERRGRNVQVVSYDDFRLKPQPEYSNHFVVRRAESLGWIKPPRWRDENPSS